MPLKNNEFTCKEPGCQLTVLYEPKLCLGAGFEAPPGDPFTAYLTCDAGHIHSYVIQST